MSVYGPDLDLGNRLRQWLSPMGVAVVEIDGWQSRGRTYATFDPYGSVNHHTAGPRGGVAPSLGVCINGRAGLPGPLCQVHQQRDDVVNLVAAGVANHAGRGGWQALSGNQSVFGLEVEHCGYPDEPFSQRRWEISCAVHAACLSGLSNPNAVMNCQHFEWSTEGKIDFCKPLLDQYGGAAGMRNQVAHLLATGPQAGGGTPAPQPPQPPPSGNAPAFPYPSSHYLGTTRPDPHCHSGFYSNDRGPITIWQAQMSNRGWTIGVDGQYGPQSEGVCRSFQAEKGLAADGLCGPQTWATSWTAPVT
jgi:peptidoglycan hydrolase-like protein with peptidoglycan-binding domain